MVDANFLVVRGNQNTQAIQVEGSLLLVIDRNGIFV